ncbi:TVP38/TMEM64 family protein [Aliikangiella coralliicola]|uniref:VTT domain-containing protein n=1 Tax=Aliikangiella coralliicola TaxID=2592383 RepID=A0A545UIR0_9GAMM|nr:VTT domain-containing protein [Aliikangiella coralliicola]TQV89347.1 VTT domain-containing protein [Aliikangiella coralliicola]
MKALLKVMFTLALFFALTFVILKATGLITVEKIKFWLEEAKNTDPLYVAAIIVALLFADLFVAVPTLTVIILGGYFLGPAAGAISAIIGLFFAGICGFGLSAKFGEKLVSFLIKDRDKRDKAMETFQNHGPVVILLSRAVPILPEVSACMAGMTRMPFIKFLLLWLLSTIPYATIASYAGSISTFENPSPALFTAIGLTIFLWSVWFGFHRFVNGK